MHLRQGDVDGDLADGMGVVRDAGRTGTGRLSGGFDGGAEGNVPVGPALVPEGEPAAWTKGFPFNGNQFASVSLATRINLPAIRDGFSRVPLDRYVADGTRYKSICRCQVCGGRVIPTPHEPLFHPRNKGAYAGHSSRIYAEIPKDDQAALAEIVVAFAEFFGIREGEDILVQQQRVRPAEADGTALTVQEEGGWHQDEVRRLGMVCINRQNIDGGISDLADGNRFRLFSRLLMPGEMVLIDDSKLWHNATAIRRVDPQAPAFRDIVILCTPSCRQF